MACALSLLLFKASCPRPETTSHNVIATTAVGISDTPTREYTVPAMKRAGEASAFGASDVRPPPELVGTPSPPRKKSQEVMIQVSKYEGLAHGELSPKAKNREQPPGARGNKSSRLITKAIFYVETLLTRRHK